MFKKVYIGLGTEGKTDERFLASIVRRAFIEVVLTQKDTQEGVEIAPIQYYREKGKNLEDQIFERAKEASKAGIHLLCIHTDADKNEKETRQRIRKAFQRIKEKRRCM